MKKVRVFLAAVFVFIVASTALATPTSDLFKAVKDERTSRYEISSLIRAGAKVNTKDKNGWTPLDWAVMNRNPDVTYELLKGGARINARDEFGNTPLMKAAYYNENPDVVQVLVDFGADIHARNDEGKTALDFARTGEIRDIIFYGPRPPRYPRPPYDPYEPPAPPLPPRRPY